MALNTDQKIVLEAAYKLHFETPQAAHLANVSTASAWKYYNYLEKLGIEKFDVKALIQSVIDFGDIRRAA